MASIGFLLINNKHLTRLFNDYPNNGKIIYIAPLFIVIFFALNELFVQNRIWDSLKIIWKIEIKEWRKEIGFFPKDTLDTLFKFSIWTVNWQAFYGLLGIFSILFFLFFYYLWGVRLLLGMLLGLGTIYIVIICCSFKIQEFFINQFKDDLKKPKLQ